MVDSIRRLILIGCLISWTASRGLYPSSAKKVRSFPSPLPYVIGTPYPKAHTQFILYPLPFSCHLLVVTDMLISILNCVSAEELDEAEEEEDTLLTPEEEAFITPSEESQEEEAKMMMTQEQEVDERRNQVKNKILAIGRMSRVFSLMR